MRDSAEPGGTGTTQHLPTGLAFEIADLMLAESWAVFNEARFAIRLDHGAEDEEYEEVIDLGTGRNSASRLIMWRSATDVFVQPLPGRQQKFRSVAEALESVFPGRRAALTDIVAAAWPAG
jgi:hypothetical protein